MYRKEQNNFLGRYSLMPEIEKTCTVKNNGMDSGEAR